MALVELELVVVSSLVLDEVVVSWILLEVELVVPGALVLVDVVLCSALLELVVDSTPDEELEELVVWASDVELDDDVALLLSLEVDSEKVKLVLVIGGVLLLSVDSEVVVPDKELILLGDVATELLLDGWEQPLS